MVGPYVSPLDGVIDLELPERWVQHVVAMLPNAMEAAVQLGAPVDYAITYSGSEGGRRLFVRTVGLTWSCPFFATSTQRIQLRHLLDDAGWGDVVGSQSTWPWDLATEG
jgi:hypothetical protein